MINLIMYEMKDDFLHCCLYEAVLKCARRKYLNILCCFLPLEVNQIICSWKIKLKVTNGITLLRLLDSVNENHNLLSLLCGFGEQLMLTHWCILYMKYLLSLCGQE